jgi:Tfp pilus assembly PilM family ATPase
MASAESRALELEEIKDSRAADMETLRMDIDANATELLVARADKIKFQKEKLAMEADLNKTLSDLKGAVLSSLLLATNLPSVQWMSV